MRRKDTNFSPHRCAGHRAPTAQISILGAGRSGSSRCDERSAWPPDRLRQTWPTSPSPHYGAAREGRITTLLKTAGVSSTHQRCRTMRIERILPATAKPARTPQRRSSASPAGTIAAPTHADSGGVHPSQTVSPGPARAEVFTAAPSVHPCPTARRGRSSPEPLFHDLRRRPPLGRHAEIGESSCRPRCLMRGDRPAGAPAPAAGWRRDERRLAPTLVPQRPGRVAISTAVSVDRACRAGSDRRAARLSGEGGR